MDTVTLTIDGRQITVEKGTTVLQAALEHGISVPYYCYHPGIGVDGSCRVCIVKIEKMPKLQIACSTVCTEGQIVHTQTPEVIEARAGIFEFLLINHPLDCPVCDKGGECPLQDYSYTFGPDQSRMEFARRTFDGEGVRADVDFGPTLMLNRNRCILCTRCIRFMRDIDGDAQINVIDRGYGSEIATFQEEGVHSLISGNLMDVCPVGAITTRDYRFKSRPWDNPEAVDTICTLCSKGCGTTAWLKAKPEWAKGASLIRFTPRFNPDVNGYWMCDIGRFGYHWVESEDRLRQPLVRDERGVQQPVSWHDVAWKLGDRREELQKGLHFLLSAHASNEEFFLFRRLAEELAAGQSARGPHEEPGSPTRQPRWGGDSESAPAARMGVGPHANEITSAAARASDSLEPKALGVGPQRREEAGAPRAVNNAPVITVSWRYQPKSQPGSTTFKVPPVDAPNVNGARSFGFVGGQLADEVTQADVSALRAAVDAGQVSALYVFDPGPEGSIGDTEWILRARARGALPLLIVQGVLLTNLARAADFVLPGASWVEKEASYVNDQGRLQGATRAIALPGEAMEDWQILVQVGVALGVPLDYTNAARIRADIATGYADRKAFEGLTALGFGRPVAAQNWLQASNPSERWKWDFMFQDLPPVKGSVDPLAVPMSAGVIPLREVK